MMATGPSGARSGAQMNWPGSRLPRSPSRFRVPSASANETARRQMASSPTLAPKRVMADLRLRSAEYSAGIISRPHMRLSTIHPVQKGSKTDEGFQPLGNLGFSIQGVAANDAWKAVLHLARALGCAVEFEGCAKEDAQHPGCRGRLAWSPAG